MPSATLHPRCGNYGPNAGCGCEYHREWVRENPNHPVVVEARADVIEWMAGHPGLNPATGRPLPHPDDYLELVYGAGATAQELCMLGLVV